MIGWRCEIWLRNVMVKRIEMRSVRVVVGCVVCWFVVAGVGCETDRGARGGEAGEEGGEAGSAVEQTRKQPDHPAFSWEDALGARVETMREKLGEPEGDPGYGCNPQQRIEKDWSRKQMPYRALVLPTGCRHPVAGREESKGAYEIDGARYDGGRAVFVRLRPVESVAMASMPSGRFGLPDVLRRRQFVLSTDEGERRVDAYRYAERPGEAKKAIGFDVVSKPGERQTVGYINVYSALSEPFARVVTLRGPVEGDGANVVLPRTESELSSGGDLGQRSYVEITPTRVKVGSLPGYPQIPAIRRHQRLAAVSFSAEEAATSGVVDGPYRDVFSYFSNHERWVREQLRSGPCAEEEGARAMRSCVDFRKDSDVVTVAVDAATSYGTFAAVLGRLGRMEHRRLKVLGVRGEHVLDKSGDLPVFNSWAVMGQPLYKEYLGVAFKRGGIVVYRSGKRVEPVDGCSGKLTLCANEAEVSAALERIASFRGEERSGEEELRAATEELVAAYPWAKLYNVLATQRRASEDGVIESVSVSLSGELPVTLAYRLADVVRYRRAEPGDTKTCVDSIEPGGFNETVRCVRTVGPTEKPKSMLPNVGFRSADASWPAPASFPGRRGMLMPEEPPEMSNGEGEEGLSKEDLGKLDEKPIEALAKESSKSSASADEEKADSTGDASSETGAEQEAPGSEWEQPVLFVSLAPGSWVFAPRDQGVTVVGEGEAAGDPERTDVREREVNDLLKMGQVVLEPGEAMRLTFGVAVRAVEVSGLAADVHWEGGEKGADALYLAGREKGVTWVRVVREDNKFVQVPVVVE